MRKCLAVTAIAAFAGSAFIPSASAQTKSYPFIGKWDCGVATFSFTDKTYNNGSETLRMTKVEKKGATYLLSFPKGYRISLAGITPKKMSWASGATGDSFDCKRVK
jgi:hypothetical protein